jgi:hypothetical protein
MKYLCALSNLLLTRLSYAITALKNMGNSLSCFKALK